MKLAAVACALASTLACASAPPPAARAHAVAPAPLAASPPSPDTPPGADPPRPPRDTVAEADGIYRDELGAGIRDDRFATDRQVAALRRAIVLYKEFLARAADDPRYAEAAKRSRDRIEDAEKTIEFLLAQGNTPSR